MYCIFLKKLFILLINFILYVSQFLSSSFFYHIRWMREVLSRETLIW